METVPPSIRDAPRNNLLNNVILQYLDDTMVHALTKKSLFERLKVFLKDQPQRALKGPHRAPRKVAKAHTGPPKFEGLRALKGLQKGSKSSQRACRTPEGPSKDS